MFADAYEKAEKFTYPVIISTRKQSGSVECGCAAFIIVNDDGWIISSAHIYSSYHFYKQHIEQIKKHNDMKVEILNNPGLDHKQKKKRISHLKVYPGWILNHSFWWGMDGVRITDIRVLGQGDLLAGRLEPFDKTVFKSHAYFKNPSSMRLASGLCRLGYPFHIINASYNDKEKRFEINKNMIPRKPYPIEGIYTRTIDGGFSEDGYRLLFIETSTPGLRGQSGGPIVDTEGAVWGLQSRTIHHPLGFSPKIKKNGREIEENQFLNTGVGVHSSLIMEFLQKNDIRFHTVD
ncbi:MAG: serine protease [Clostridia bacterium]|nr:serine protease [Clostridia bacterium]